MMSGGFVSMDGKVGEGEGRRKEKEKGEGGEGKETYIWSRDIVECVFAVGFLGFVIGHSGFGCWLSVEMRKSRS